MRYWPVLSVTPVRTFSISAGLDASTVTPGKTPPDSSLTVPVRVPCANTADGRRTAAIRIQTARDAPRIVVLLGTTRSAERPASARRNCRAFNVFWIGLSMKSSRTGHHAQYGTVCLRGLRRRDTRQDQSSTAAE